MAVMRPSGTAIITAPGSHHNRADDQRQQAEFILDGIPPIAQKIAQRDLAEGRQPLMDEEEKNQPDNKIAEMPAIRIKLSITNSAQSR